MAHGVGQTGRRPVYRAGRTVGSGVWKAGSCDCIGGAPPNCEEPMTSRSSSSILSRSSNWNEVLSYWYEASTYPAQWRNQCCIKRIQSMLNKECCRDSVEWHNSYQVWRREKAPSPQLCRIPSVGPVSQAQTSSVLEVP